MAWFRRCDRFRAARAEAFNSTFKIECVHRHRFRTRAEARLKIAAWICACRQCHPRRSSGSQASLGVRPLGSGRGSIAAE
ncbi:integrase core domain-containing protein [Nonomuraea africana]